MITARNKETGEVCNFYLEFPPEGYVQVMDETVKDGTTFMPYDGSTVKYPGETCKCCGGTGVQTRNDGIKIKCPACNGTGNWNVQPYEITWHWAGSPWTYVPNWSG